MDKGETLLKKVWNNLYLLNNKAKSNSPIQIQNAQDQFRPITFKMVLLLGISDQRSTDLKFLFWFQKLWKLPLKMKPKVRPTNSGVSGDSGKSGNSHNSGNSEVKMVRFAATSSLVKEDLTSLLEICNKSMVHQNWPWKKCEPYVPNDEEIYSDLRKRGLKIKNQR